MRSLAIKLIAAFLVVSLAGTALVALLAGRATADEFGQFVITQNQELFVDELAGYYQTHGSWVGIDGLFPGGRAPRMGGRGSGGGGMNMNAWGMMLLVDSRGYAMTTGVGHQAGEKLSSAELAKGVPVEVNGNLVGTLILTPDPFQPTLREQAFLSQVNRALLLAALGATGLALVLGVLLARALTNPLREMTAATHALAAGNLGRQVPVRSEDELGQLASSFNQMSADLAQSRDRRRQMTADIAHDLRTPLSVILGHAEALRDGVLPANEETFFIIHDEAQRLSRLVEDLRTLSLAETNELSMARRLTTAQFLLERAATTQSAIAQQQNISLQVEATPNLPELDVDPDRMAQVLSNLLDNALRHTPTGGRILLAAERSDAGVRLSVQDNGSGIAPEEQSRIFDRFYRTDKSRQRRDGGTGLGLAIARSIVLQHGGRIWAESELGQGASIFVELPAAAR